MFVYAFVCKFYLLITADSEPPLAVKCVWISMCVVLLVFGPPSVSSREGKSLNMTGREETRPWQRTHTVWGGQTHMYITNKRIHTHTQHLRLLAS